MAFMASKTNILFYLTISVLVFCYFSTCKAQKVPAMYVLGDSLVDVGTNNYLTLSLAKADFPHNGIDYPNKKATGRFNNGYNTADFLAEKIGLSTSPPFLSLVTLKDRIKREVSFPITGVSFASGGAGIFNTTNQLFGQTIPLARQIEQFTRVNNYLVQSLGFVGAKNHLSKSLFTVVIGNNDLISYFDSASVLPKISTPQQYIESMVSALKDDLKKIYSFGARKFVIGGVGSIGCTPSLRNQNRIVKNDCNDEANNWVVKYNEGLKSMLHDLQKLELKDMIYSYVDLFNIFASFLQNPANYGFVEVKSACCGLGNLRADVPCVPVSKFCSNRTNHIFWDLYHPSEAAAHIFVDIVYSGSAPYALPINVDQLVTM